MQQIVSNFIIIVMSITMMISDCGMMNRDKKWSFCIVYVLKAMF
jgi:hypothetical protein